MNVFLSKKEVSGIGLILFFILFISFFNFKVSLRQARDVQRNLDVTAIAQGLSKYVIDYGHYPLSSSDGRIIACEGPETEVEDPLAPLTHKKPKLTGLVECQWGQDSLLDLLDINYPHYLDVIPADPRHDKDISYRYISNGEEYQIYGAFEGRSLGEYDKSVRLRKLKCGKRICNFGKASPKTLLDKPIEEQED